MCPWQPSFSTRLTLLEGVVIYRVNVSLRFSTQKGFLIQFRAYKIYRPSKQMDSDQQNKQRFFVAIYIQCSVYVYVAFKVLCSRIVFVFLGFIFLVYKHSFVILIFLRLRLLARYTHIPLMKRTFVYIRTYVYMYIHFIIYHWILVPSDFPDGGICDIDILLKIRINTVGV